MNSQILSFFAGVVTYAAVQAGALAYFVDLLRYVLPPQIHFTIVLVFTLFSMFFKVLLSKMKSSVSKTIAFVSKVSLVTKPEEVIRTADIPTRSMRKPRSIEQNLTSEEFMPGLIQIEREDAANLQNTVTDSQDVKID
jgi:hypothetical protein